MKEGDVKDGRRQKYKRWRKTGQGKVKGELKGKEKKI